MKKIPKRTCIGCNQEKEKKELLRIVKNKEGTIFFDQTGKANGRGAYLCKNQDCLEKAMKTKRLEKIFETKIDSKLYDTLKEGLK